MDPVLTETVAIVDELAALRARVRQLTARLAELKTELATDADDGSYTLDAGDAAIVMRVRHTAAFPYRSKEPELFARLDTAARGSPWWHELSDLSHTRVRACWEQRETGDNALRDLLADFVAQKRDVSFRVRRSNAGPTMPT